MKSNILFNLFAVLIFPLITFGEESLDINYRGFGKLCYQEKGDIFEVSASDFKKGIWSPPSISLDCLYRSLVLSLPEKKVQVGETWEIKCTLENIGDCWPIEVAGRCKLANIKKTKDDKEAIIIGSFLLSRELSHSFVQKDKSFSKITSCKISYTATYSVSKGVIVNANYEFSIKYKKQGTTRIVEKKETFQLVQQKKLDKEVNKEPVTEQEVDQAIQKGVQYLTRMQRKNGSWGDYEGYKSGPTALALLALLKAGVKPDHSMIQDGFSYLHKQTIDKTYEAAILLMALQALCEAYQPKKGTKYIALHSDTHHCRLSPENISLMKRTVSFLENGVYRGTWNYTKIGAYGFDKNIRYDHSNTQYAVLGLRSAQQCGVSVDASVWQDVLKHFLECQERKDSGNQVSVTTGGDALPRGWGYTEKDGATMTMTCAGVACVLIAREQLDINNKVSPQDRSVAIDSIKCGLSWIKNNYNQFIKSSDGYLLYGLERVGVLAQVECFEKRDWYQDGARLFIDAQIDSGEFLGGYRGVINTVFAILFLKRATAPITITPQRE